MVNIYVSTFGVKELMSFGQVNVVVKLVFYDIWIIVGNDPFGVFVKFRIGSFCKFGYIVETEVL